MVEQTLRVGVIGAGAVSTFGHIPGYQRHPQVELVAISDIDEERLQRVAQTHSIPHTFARAEDLLAMDELAAVSICTPNYLHAPQSIAALQAGKHVLCEKPLAIRAAEAEKMAAVAQQAGRKLMVCLNNRFRPDLRRLKRLVENGLLGDLYHARVVWLRRAGIPVGNSWLTNRTLSGGGVLIDLGVHMLDLALWLMGYPEPVSVSGATHAQFGPRRLGVSEKYGCPEGRMPEGQLFDVEDMATGLVRLGNGASIGFELSWAAPIAIDDDISLKLLGSEGGADLSTPDYAQEDALQLHLGSDRPVDDLDAAAVPALTGHAAAIDHFVHCILRDEEPSIRLQEMVSLTRIIDGLYRSAALGHEIGLHTAADATTTWRSPS